MDNCEEKELCLRKRPFGAVLFDVFTINQKLSFWDSFLPCRYFIWCYSRCVCHNMRVMGGGSLEKLKNTAVGEAVSEQENCGHKALRTQGVAFWKSQNGMKRLCHVASFCVVLHLSGVLCCEIFSTKSKDVSLLVVTYSEHRAKSTSFQLVSLSQHGNQKTATPFSTLFVHLRDKKATLNLMRWLRTCTFLASGLPRSNGSTWWRVWNCAECGWCLILFNFYILLNWQKAKRLQIVVLIFCNWHKSSWKNKKLFCTTNILRFSWYFLSSLGGFTPFARGWAFLALSFHALFDLFWYLFTVLRFPCIVTVVVVYIFNGGGSQSILTW